LRGAVSAEIEIFTDRISALSLPIPFALLFHQNAQTKGQAATQNRNSKSIPKEEERRGEG